MFRARLDERAFHLEEGKAGPNHRGGERSSLAVLQETKLCKPPLDIRYGETLAGGLVRTVALLDLRQFAPQDQHSDCRYSYLPTQGMFIAWGPQEERLQLQLPAQEEDFVLVSFSTR